LKWSMTSGKTNLKWEKGAIVSSLFLCDFYFWINLIKNKTLGLKPVF
jgi:hypothetical protein